MAPPGALLRLALLAAQLAPALPKYTECAGTEFISQDMWTLARQVDKAIQTSHVGRDFIGEVARSFFHIAHSGAMREAIEDCALGVAVLAVHSLPDAERTFGRKVALDYFRLYQSLVADFGHLRRENGFSWHLDTHQSAGYPLLLGLRPQSCFGLDLKVFVYDEVEFAQQAISCGQSMFASEVFVHQFLMHSACRTLDPAEADFFFVPVYAACVMTKEQKNASDMDAFYKSLVDTQLTHFHKRGGRDHIFLWSSESYDFPSWLEHIHPSIFLSVENHPIECSDHDFFSEETASNFEAWCRHCPWCFTPWKDVLIPGFVEKWSMGKMAALERASEERTYTACYHGTDSAHLALYQFANATVRNDLQTLRGLPNVSIGYRYPIVSDYFKVIGDCHFCFAPKGLGYWSNRLYEVMYAGCIPVVLSDNIGLPFDGDLVDWSTFSLKWPMAEVSPKLIEYLEDLLANRRDYVKELHMNVLKNRCWFDYNSEDEECSPYLGILKALEKRKEAFPAMPSRHWGHTRASI